MRQRKEMYNPELKNECLSTSTDPDSFARLFKKTSDYEQIFAKDLCEFDLSQYISMLSNVQYSRMSYISIRSKIKSYVHWCVQHNAVGSDQLNVMEQLYKYERQSKSSDEYSYYANQDEIFDIIEGIMESSDIDIHIIQRVCCIYACAILQLKPEDMCNIKRSDIDLENHKLSYNNHVYQLSDRMLQYFDEVYHQDKVYIINSQRKNNMKPGEYLFRTTRADHVSYDYFFNVYHRIVKRCQNELAIGDNRRLYDLSYANIMENGAFMDIYAAIGDKKCTYNELSTYSRYLSDVSAMTQWTYIEKYNIWYNTKQIKES